MEISVRLNSAPFSIKALEREDIAAFDRAAAVAGMTRSSWVRSLLHDLDERAARARVTPHSLARCVLLAAASRSSLVEDLEAARSQQALRLDHVQLTAYLTPDERQRVLAWGDGPSDAVREMLRAAEQWHALLAREAERRQGDMELGGHDAAAREALAARARAMGLEVVETR